MDRPKRNVPKPTRYQTTSSEDEVGTRPSKRAAISSITTNVEIDRDIDDLRTILQDDRSTNINKNHYNIYSQSPELQQQSQNYPSQMSTNTLSHTYIPPTSTAAYTTLTPISHTSTHNHDTINFLNSATPFPTHTHTRTDGVILNSNTYDNQFQANSRSCGPARNNQDNYETSSRINEEIIRSINLLHERMDRVEIELKGTNTSLQTILRCVQDQRGVPRKPAILPMSSLAEMDDFENADKDRYTDVVNYLQYIGGFNLKEAINLCLKEALKDSLTPSFTWWGREGGPRPLYNTRIIIAIYDAVCKNRHFQKPTRTEFQNQAKEALRTAKERARTKLQGPRIRMPNPRNRRGIWNDEPEQEEEAT